MTNPGVPPNENRSMMHDSWVATCEALVDKNGINSAVGELSFFLAEVLKRCGDTPELKQFIDQRTLKAFDSVDKRKGAQRGSR